MRVLCEPWTSEWPIMDLEFPQSRYNISDHFSYLWNISHWEAFLEMKQAFWRKWESYFKKQWRGTIDWKSKVLKKHEISASLQRIIFGQVFLETGKKLHCMRKVMLEKNHGIKAAEMLKIISGPWN